jgi:hypothetical protein
MIRFQMPMLQKRGAGGGWARALSFKHHTKGVPTKTTPTALGGSAATLLPTTGFRLLWVTLPGGSTERGAFGPPFTLATIATLQLVSSEVELKRCVEKLNLNRNKLPQMTFLFFPEG